MIRRATREDIDIVMAIVRNAQRALAELDIDQWQDGYPEREVIHSDIDQGIGYVECDEHDVPQGYIAIVFDGEPAYQQIASSDWHTANSYVVVHRICVSDEARRRGTALRLMRYAADLAMQRGIYAMRIDTHEGNV